MVIFGDGSDVDCATRRYSRALGGMVSDKCLPGIHELLGCSRDSVRW